MEKFINVATGEVKVSEGVGVSKSTAIGSCVVIAGCDTQKNLGVMTNIMLPGHVSKNTYNESTRYAVDTIYYKVITIIGTLSSGEDITDRKKAEEELFDYPIKLKSLASKLLVIEERERCRLATALHDQIGQSLVMSKLKLDSLRESVSSDTPVGILDDVRDLS